MSEKDHDFHIVDPSPWPILTSFSMLLMALGFTMFLHEYPFGSIVSIAGILAVGSCCFGWWREVINEGLIGKFHTTPVQAGLRLGMALFIMSELMFFFAFFFSFFYASVFPAGILEDFWVVKEGSWPPEGIKTFNPWDLPFINTLILLLSGTTATWAHYAIEERNQRSSVIALTLTVLLGVSFSILQGYEYSHAAFALTDGVYAANFYLATGFHGIHVIVGTIFLAVCLFRAARGDFLQGDHLGFEFAAWYWHFVDVVWLFLYVFVYILGS